MNLWEVKKLNELNVGGERCIISWSYRPCHLMVKVARKSGRIGWIESIASERSRRRVGRMRDAMRRLHWRKAAGCVGRRGGRRLCDGQGLREAAVARQRVLTRAEERITELILREWLTERLTSYGRTESELICWHRRIVRIGLFRRGLLFFRRHFVFLFRFEFFIFYKKNFRLYISICLVVVVSNLWRVYMTIYFKFFFFIWHARAVRLIIIFV